MKKTLFSHEEFNALMTPLYEDEEKTKKAILILGKNYSECNDISRHLNPDEKNNLCTHCDRTRIYPVGIDNFTKHLTNEQILYKIDIDSSFDDLMCRCKDCRKNIEK